MARCVGGAIIIRMSLMPDVIEILPGAVQGTVSAPPSKSYTNRALLLAALADGVSAVRSPLRSDDAEAMTEALRALGVRIDDEGDALVVHGTGGFSPPAGPVDCRDSGTTIRFLTAAVALCDFPVTLTGSLQLQRRPLGPLLDALRALGAEVTVDGVEDCPPVTVRGPLQPGPVEVDTGKSSQYASALLMALAVTGSPDARLTVRNMVSKPYVDMTLDSICHFGPRWAPTRGDVPGFRLKGGEGYQPHDYSVEFDASAAGHLLAVAALAGGEMTIAPAVGSTRQPDFRLAQILRQMGADVRVRGDSVSITRSGPLKGAGTVDMRDWPDMLSTVAVLAAFADSATVITGAAHARGHETDRIAATATELRKMGVTVVERPDGLTVFGGHPHRAEICTYGDHRMAMSFAAAGAAIPGILIMDPSCVRKTYPEFWTDLRRLGVDWREASV